ncbi:hypothetical protein BHE90_016978 [Fusarium euwallaceae]|uniref:Uncharacterized protein n=1 Tax=Fusarium euwallaceae TaxID=1147111 RepID=A0A430KYW6_9HYPO|nr:hypothetical protein BHE90_016978 [Fusarium euwallaceae]
MRARLESREIRHEVPEAAIESIRHVGQMEKYDEAAQIIHHILKNFWMDWLQRIKPPNTDVRTQVENLFSKPEISVLVFPSATCHETRADNLLSHDITSSMDPNHINPISETSNTAPRHMVVIRDAYGFERQFDFDILQQVIASVPDTSGHMRNVHISALADALMDYRFRTQTQSSSTFIPAIKMPEQFYYVGAEFAN